MCIPAAFVKQAKEYVGDKLAICTVIGFPNGYSTTAVKVFETKDAIQNGADEIDMVIQIGTLREKKYDAILQEIRAVKEECGEKILKVIIETCLLTEEEKIEMCRIVGESGADYMDFYNTKRPHRANNYQTPNCAEERFYQRKTNCAV